MPSFTTFATYIVGGYTALTVALFVMSWIGFRAAGFVARVLSSYAALMAACFIGIFAGLTFRMMGQAASGQWATGRTFKWMMLFVTGVLFTIEDPNGYLDKTRPAVLIGNHQTELDVLMLGTIFPKNCSVTAKKSIKRIPFLGWFMALSGSIFIDRKNAKDARQAMAVAATEMQTKNQSVYIFPEGTRSYSKEPMLLPFKKGAFHLAIQGGVPIVPIVVANYSHILWIRGLLFNSGRIPCKVLAPIPTAGLTSADVDSLAQTTRDLMLKEIVALTARARGEKVAIPVVAATEAVVRATGVEVKEGM